MKTYQYRVQTFPGPRAHTASDRIVSHGEIRAHTAGEAAKKALSRVVSSEPSVLSGLVLRVVGHGETAETRI